MDLEKQESLKAPLLNDNGSPSQDRSFVGRLHGIVESRSYYWLLFIGVLVNLVGFLLSTEEEPPSGEVAEWVFMVDTFSAWWFLFDYIARIITAPRRGSSNRLAYMLFDWYAYVDVVSFLPYFIDLLYFRHDFCIATQWMKVLRLFYPLQKTYLGFNFFGTLFSSHKSLLLTSGFCGFTNWVICAALYYYFEHDNDEMIYCPNGEKHKETCYNRFESIPSAMYFSLLNFFGEYPLIDNHRGGGAVVAVFIQIVGAAVVAIPAGLFGSAFEEVVQKGVQVDDDEEEECAEAVGIVGIADGLCNHGKVTFAIFCHGCRHAVERMRKVSRHSIRPTLCIFYISRIGSGSTVSWHAGYAPRRIFV